jgi:arsenate reductase-like glutaredoxin family protein
MSKASIVKLYGAEDCHKTNYYKELLDAKKHPYQFFDVRVNENNAEELRNLYESRKLNFPTITIGSKKLRNPRKEELEKWLDKLIE